MNKAILTGNVGQDPQLTTVSGDKKVVKFSLAVSEYAGKNENGESIQNTTWFNIVAWNKTAETIATYVKKGQRILVEGRISIREYEKDSIKHKAIEIVADNFEFTGSKSDGGNTSSASGSSNSGKSGAKSATPAAAPVMAENTAPDGDDLPF